MVDEDSFDEFKRLRQNYRLRICEDRWMVGGIVANQRLVLKNKKGELQMGRDL